MLSPSAASESTAIRMADMPERDGERPHSPYRAAMRCS